MICIPIMDATNREALRSVERCTPAADAIELRMDLIQDGNLDQLMAKARRISGRIKIIVTCRRKAEALLAPSLDHSIRKKEIPRTLKVKLLKQAVELGADFIDIELAEGQKTIGQLKSFCQKRKSPTRIIVSWHDINRTPSLKALKDIFDACNAAGADVIKIVPFARQITDNIKILNLISYAKAKHRKIISMCMGDQGQISRAIAPLWGSYLAFAVLPGGKKSAPGQMTVKDMREFKQMFQRQKCFPQSWLLPPGASNFVLIGNPVRHSLSPLMHNKALEAMKIDGHYSSFCVTDVAQAIAGIRGMNIRGVSVTIPFKTTVMEYLDEIDADAVAMGAVNTIVNERGRLAGYNTDWSGVTRALKDQTDIAGKTFVIVGAGGAARAAVYGIKKEGGHPVIVNRTADAGRELAVMFDCPFYPLAALGGIKAYGLINSTSVGMYPHIHQSPVEAGILGNFRLVMDVIYNPMKTKLLRDAEAHGLTIVSGAEMFVYQGAEQLKLWTGRDAPLELMRKTVRERLEKFET